MDLKKTSRSLSTKTKTKKLAKRVVALSSGTAAVHLALLNVALGLVMSSVAFFKVGMCLPAGQHVTDEDVKYIVETIKSAII